MIFQERQVLAGYTYTVEDVFGTITITSDRQKIASKLLDDIVSGILQANTTVGNITPEVAFVWNRPAAWLPEDKVIEPELKPGECEFCHSANTVQLSLTFFVVGFLLLVGSLFGVILISQSFFLPAAALSLLIMCFGPMLCDNAYRCLDCAHLTRGRTITSKDSLQ